MNIEELSMKYYKRVEKGTAMKLLLMYNFYKK